MAVATGLTATRMLEIEKASVVSARRENGELILTTRGGTDINVGDVTGTQGPIGPDGASRYTWLKYATSPTTGMSNDPLGKNYIGLAYNKTTAIESNAYADYYWTLIRGPEGQQGVPGPPGDDGEPTYIWIKYATDATGSGLSDSPTNKDYIGIAYNKSTSVESADPLDYSWSLIKGVKGDKGDPGTDGLPGPPGTDGLPNFTWLKYAITPTTGMSDDPTGKDYIGLAYNKATSTESTTYSDYAWSLIKGPQGGQGVPGTPGTNGEPRYVWIKYASSIVGDSLSDDPTGKDYIGLAYNKTTSIESTEPLDYTWSLYKGPPGDDGRGITDSEISYQASSSGVLIPMGTWLTDPPALSAGQYLWTRTKTSYSAAPFEVMSYSVGQMGQTGSAGIGITAAVVRYQIHSNGITPPIGTWLTDPPSGSEGQFFWTRTVTSYTSGSDTIAYSVALLGQTGPPGPATYVWIKYADTILGAGLSDDSAGKAYIGIAYNKTTTSESTNPLDYQWTLVQGSPLVVGTQSGITGAWTGLAPFATLLDGQQITYWLPFDGSGNATLNLTLSGGTLTGAIPCYYSGSTRLNTHMVAGNAVKLTYRVNANVAGTQYTGWWSDGQYVDGNTYDRVQYRQNILAKTDIAAGQVIAGDIDGFAPLVDNYAFDITIPILYAQSAIANTASGTDNYTSYPEVNLQITKPGWVGTIRKSVFLKGAFDGSIFIVDPEVFVDTPVDTGDGDFYILLGQLYNTTSILLYAEHPIYKFANGQFKSLAKIGSDTQSQVESTLVAINNVAATVAIQDTRLVILEDPINGLPAVLKSITSINDLLGTNNHIFRSTEPPDATPGVTGDQWWQHDSTNAIVNFWIHNGEAGEDGWVETKLSDAIFNTISADKISAGEIDGNIITISNLPSSAVVDLDSQLSTIGKNVGEAQDAIKEIVGVIKIGDGQITIVNGLFKMVLDHDSIEFKINDINIASIIGNKLIVKDAEIANVPTATALIGAHELSIGGIDSGPNTLLNKVTVFRSR